MQTIASKNPCAPLWLEFLIQPEDFAKRQHGEAKGGGTLAGKWQLIKRTWAYIFKLRRELASRQR